MLSSKFKPSYRLLNVNDFRIVEEFIDGQLPTITKDYFYPPGTAIIEKSLSDTTGVSHGAFENGLLIGVRLSYKPGLNNENHAYDLEYSDVELNQVAQFHGTIVVNNKRYKGIGNQLVQDNCKEIFKRNFSRILATAHPDNLASIHMLLKNEFYPKLKVSKYQDLPRLIFRDVNNSCLRMEP